MEKRYSKNKQIRSGIKDNGNSSKKLAVNELQNQEKITSTKGKSANFWGNLGNWVKEKVDCCLE